MDSSPSRLTKALEPTLPSTAGRKRSASSLLPAFEPLSSSPGLPRPAKRPATAKAFQFLQYPTPAPTSSTGILSSSPPRVGARPAPQRSQSSLSERAPLSDVRSVELSENGDALLMGRSSNSSHYQLSANRLISRVHVQARYIAASDPLEPNRIEIICSGWNGLKLHCQGQTWELAKGDSFTSETEGAEIMVDVQDARVFVQWPQREKERDTLGHLSDSSWDESPRPRRGRTTGSSELHGSPLRRSTRLSSPESPTPANVDSSSRASLDDLLPGNEDVEAVQIYEDDSADEQELPKLSAGKSADGSSMTQATQSFSSDLSDPQSDGEPEHNDPNEENDPILHSFGPYGANLSGRLASFSAASSRMSNTKSRSSAISRAPLAEVSEEPLSSSPNDKGSNDKGSSTPSSPSKPAPTLAEITGLGAEQTSNITNHAVNQLAFSRLSSTPLSTIMNNLPAAEKKGLSKDSLRVIIEGTSCVGIIRRQGKDAAGKPLESEYYYIPELDTDEHRRLAVTESLRKPSLRACRKQHKQYFWKRPKTP
ncbi:protein PLM2 [Cladorrhinum samala]|uniref:Protein PLM2 n=1 Tax=Cladorrhinum samala TaxID=585594 RepID=A0AAV9HJQ5_9PEZI|nr:protein PLM2 [Cladorrhinum samala]